MQQGFRVYILTLFPDFFASLCDYSLFQRACQHNGLILNTINIRDFSQNKHRKCDDVPYGGGSGMVMTPQPIWDAMQSLPWQDCLVIGLSARGLLLQQALVQQMAAQLGLAAQINGQKPQDNAHFMEKMEHIPQKWYHALFGEDFAKKGKKSLIFICGHYEGIDQRVLDYFCDFELSIGDYILIGGETAALVVLESLLRYLPGFLGNAESLAEESFNDNLLEYPHYTRPAVFNDMSVPDVLLQGHHAKIDNWRKQAGLDHTKQVRPDLWIKFIDKKS